MAEPRLPKKIENTNDGPRYNDKVCSNFVQQKEKNFLWLAFCGM